MEHRLSEIIQRVEGAAKQAGRDPKEVTLMGVTKTRTPEEIAALHGLGVRLFGENRVQEITQKFGDPALLSALGIAGGTMGTADNTVGTADNTVGTDNSAAPYELHMIGHLQSNKVAKVVPLVSCIQSMDSLKLIHKVAEVAKGVGKTLGVMVEYNTSGESNKAGFTTVNGCLQGVEAILQYPSLKLQGCMTIGPLGGTEREVRTAFQRLYGLRETIYQHYPELTPIHLSMGMSGDFEIAIEEGATLIRVGTYLFGPRGQGVAM